MGLVIDACVLRSASDNEAPCPREARQVLSAARDSGIKVAACELLLAEWRRHNSAYARRWLVAMYSRRLIKKVAAFSGRAASVDAALARLAPAEQPAAIKDAHLIKIALDHGRLVVSAELVCARKFREASLHYAEIGNVVWVLPSYGYEALEVITTKSAPPLDWLIANFD